MDAIASQITSLTIVYSNVYSGADQSKHQSSASLAFVWGIHRGPVNSPHKWPVTRKMFPFDDVIMIIHYAIVSDPIKVYGCHFCSTLHDAMTRISYNTLFPSNELIHEFRHLWLTQSPLRLHILQILSDTEIFIHINCLDNQQRMEKFLFVYDAPNVWFVFRYQISKKIIQRYLLNAYC